MGPKFPLRSNSNGTCPVTHPLYAFRCRMTSSENLLRPTSESPKCSASGHLVEGLIGCCFAHAIGLGVHMGLGIQGVLTKYMLTIFTFIHSVPFVRFLGFYARLSVSDA